MNNVPVQRLLQQLDDENVPVEYNIFDSTPAHELVEELSHQANFFVARKIFSAMPDKAFLRRQFSPNPRRLNLFEQRMNRLGFEIDASSSGDLQSSLCKIQDVEIRKGMETLIAKAMQRAKYFVSSSASDEMRQHYMLNVPVYTHFTNPSRRYTDIIVHRQLEAVLSEGAVEFTDDVESLRKTADLCNNKKDSALNAQEQSVHIEACRNMDRKSSEIGGDLISEGIVLCVYESAFDVLIPEYGFEKRVHCDQLPLKKAEFRKDSRVLELYWEKGVPSSAYIPEDERAKPGNSRAAQAAAAAREAEAARERAREHDEAMRKQTETGTMSADDVDALFDDDDEDVNEASERISGVSLSSADRSTQSMPPSPTRNGHQQQGPHRTRSDPKIASGTGDAPENKLNNKEKYLSLFKLREVDGDLIQDVTEMTRVPIILKTDLSKSPPYVLPLIDFSECLELTNVFPDASLFDPSTLMPCKGLRSVNFLPWNIFLHALQISRSCGTCCVSCAPTDIIHRNKRTEHQCRDVIFLVMVFLQCFIRLSQTPPCIRRVLGSLYLFCYMREAVVCFLSILFELGESYYHRSLPTLLCRLGLMPRDTADMDGCILAHSSKTPFHHFTVSITKFA